MDDLKRHALCRYCGTRGTEMQYHIAAIGTFERTGDFALIRQTASLAERRFDEAHARPAFAADKPLFRTGTFYLTQLADPRIKPRQPRLQMGANLGREQGAR